MAPAETGVDDAKTKAASAAPAETLIEAVVKRGTVHTGFGKGAKTYGPGATVSLPADEVARLTRLGVLVDPDAEAVPTGQGPTYSAAAGPAVSRG